MLYAAHSLRSVCHNNVLVLQWDLYNTLSLNAAGSTAYLHAHVTTRPCGLKSVSSITTRPPHNKRIAYINNLGYRYQYTTIHHHRSASDLLPLARSSIITTHIPPLPPPPTSVVLNNSASSSTTHNARLPQHLLCLSASSTLHSPTTAIQSNGVHENYHVVGGIHTICSLDITAITIRSYCGAARLHCVEQSSLQRFRMHSSTGPVEQSTRLLHCEFYKS